MIKIKVCYLRMHDKDRCQMNAWVDVNLHEHIIEMLNRCQMKVWDLF